MVCKHCQKEYSKKEVIRVFGDMWWVGSYCSAKCFTASTAAQQPLAPDVCPVCLGKKLVQTKSRGVVNCASCNGTGQRR